MSRGIGSGSAGPDDDVAPRPFIERAFMPTPDAKLELDAALKRAERELQAALMWAASWCPHGYDSARSMDYATVGPIRDRINGALKALRDEA